MTRYRLSIKIIGAFFFLILVITSLVIVLSIGSSTQTSTVNHTWPDAKQAYRSMPISFEPNVGHVQSGIKFSAHVPGGSLVFSQSEITFARVTEAIAPISDLVSAKAVPVNQKQLSCYSTSLNMQFIGSSSAADLHAGEILSGKVNYIEGNDPSNWHTNISTYSGVTFSGLYPGVDLRYDGDQGHLKGTYTLAPAADPALIAWRYKDSKSVVLEQNGDLQVTLGSSCATQSSSDMITEQAPVAWQDINGQRLQVSISYVLHKDNTIGFAVGAYNTVYPLVIDPTLVYSSFLGGSDDDNPFAIATDTEGNIYVSGATVSADFPVASAMQPNIGGHTDAFVAKLTPDGSQLIYATYLGGNSAEVAWQMAVKDGNAYVAGYTMSNNFPTYKPYQANINGAMDGFVAELSADGSSLLYSTYFGGSGHEEATAIALDTNGNIYIAGGGDSLDFPTMNAYQSQPGGADDAFVSELSADGSKLLYSTYLGGIYNDSAARIEARGQDLYVVGATESEDFPILNAVQRENAGVGDAFVAKFEGPDMNVRYVTYLGGSGGESGFDISSDKAGNAFVTGSTRSDDFPIVSAYQPHKADDGLFDAFVTKISSDGSSFLYSTYLGGSNHDESYSIVADDEGNAYITGYTLSEDFPTVDAIQSTLAGTNDVFVSKLAPNGHLLLFSTYLGGTKSEVSRDITLDSAGNIWITGETLSPDFPVAGDPVQENKAGHFDLFITKLANTCSVTFSDVPVNSPFYSAVHCLVCQGIASGYPDGTFHVDRPITRGQLAKLAVNAVGFTEQMGDPQYQDVEYESTFYTYIWKLTTRGIMRGYACGGLGEPCGPANLPYFRPNANVTRGQLAKVVAESAGFSDPVGAQQFEDVLPGSTFYNDIWRLADRGVLVGYPCGGPHEPCGADSLRYFRPGASASRGQAAKIIVSALLPDCSAVSK